MKKIMVIILLLITVVQSGAMTVDHAALQRQFLGIQRQLGITTPKNIVHSLRRPAGKQGTQSQFNELRADLNNLLSQEVLSNEDSEQINQKINQLNTLHPARWPRAEDYKKVLNIKRGKVEATRPQCPSTPN